MAKSNIDIQTDHTKAIEILKRNGYFEYNDTIDVLLRMAQYCDIRSQQYHIQMEF